MNEAGALISDILLNMNSRTKVAMFVKNILNILDAKNLTLTKEELNEAIKMKSYVDNMKEN